jgi:dTDP-4-dehydrorhamnose 3,5-epimerase
MKMQESTDPEFVGFGEIYFSTVYPGVIKGWHLHKKTTLNYAVIKGMIKLVLYDDRDGSPTRGELMELFLGDNNYCLVQIPTNIWNGFKGVGTEMSIVADLTDLPHDPDDMVRLNPTDNGIIPYDWALKNL